jgi:hypothetical protein
VKERKETGKRNGDYMIEEDNSGAQSEIKKEVRK